MPLYIRMIHMRYISIPTRLHEGAISQLEVPDEKERCCLLIVILFIKVTWFGLLAPSHSDILFHTGKTARGLRDEGACRMVRGAHSYWWAEGGWGLRRRQRLMMFRVALECPRINVYLTQFRRSNILFAGDESGSLENWHLVEITSNSLWLEAWPFFRWKIHHSLSF